MEKLISQISAYGKLSPGDQELIRQTVRTVYFPKDTPVIEAGKIDDSIYFIRKGVWRAYTERHGEQLTLWFAVTGESVFSSWGYLRGLPSRFTIAASCDSVAIELKKSTIQRLLASVPEISGWLHSLFVDIILSSDDLLVDIASPKAESRYLAFMKKMPEIFRDVPLKEIAGFLGVTPQSLSRIRSGLARGEGRDEKS